MQIKAIYNQTNNFPTIEEIEQRSEDERVRKTVMERVSMANDPKSVFISHEEVFAASRARLMAKLSGQGNA